MKDLWYGDPDGLQISEAGNVRFNGVPVETYMDEEGKVFARIGEEMVDVGSELRRLRRERCRSVCRERKKVTEVYEYDPETFEVICKWASTLEAAHSLDVKHAAFVKRLGRGCVSRGRLFLDRIDSEAARKAFEWNKRWSAAPVEMFDTFKGNLIATFRSVNEAAKESGCSTALISLQLNGKYTSNCEYTFRRAVGQ